MKTYYWRSLTGTVGLIVFCAAVSIAREDHQGDADPRWAFVVAFTMSSVIVFLLGIIADQYEAMVPQPMEVLLRHNNKAWVLTVMRAHEGAIYAPVSQSDRRMREVDIKTVSPSMLGSPKFTEEKNGGFTILGQTYLIN
jgi:hypothetical protein